MFEVCGDADTLGAVSVGGDARTPAATAPRVSGPWPLILRAPAWGAGSILQRSFREQAAMTESHETRPAPAIATAGDDLEVIVVGGGQAGLAIGYFLAQQGRKFAILEAADEPAATWRDRWDSLKLFTSVRYSGLPGLPSPAIRTATRAATTSRPIRPITPGISPCPWCWAAASGRSGEPKIGTGSSSRTEPIRPIRS